MGVQVVGVGSYAPDKLVRNEDLAALGCDPDWIVQRTGIVERRHAPPEIATSDMAVIAAEECIEDAGVDPSEIDLVLLGTFTPDQLLPASACLVQDRLGLSAPAMDLHAACASFAFAMITGAQFVASGSSKLVLVIGADCNLRVVNPEDKQTYPLFGDAAGAVLLAPDRTGRGCWALPTAATDRALNCSTARWAARAGRSPTTPRPTARISSPWRGGPCSSGRSASSPSRSAKSSN